MDVMGGRWIGNEDGGWVPQWNGVWNKHDLTCTNRLN